MPDLYTHTPLMLDYEPDMLVTYRWLGGTCTGLTAGPDKRLHSDSTRATWNADLFGGDTVLVCFGPRGSRVIPKADIVRVGKRTFASSVEVDDVLLYEDGMTQEVTGVGGDNVGRFDSSDYTLFVVVADTEA